MKVKIQTETEFSFYVFAIGLVMAGGELKCGYLMITSL